MERQTNQLTFLDNVVSDLGGKRTAAFFTKCDQYIPWEALAEPLRDMYHNDTSKEKKRGQTPFWSHFQRSFKTKTGNDLFPNHINSKLKMKS